MAEQITPETQIAPEPGLTKRFVDPKGVLQKNMKLFLYLGAALLVIVAAVFSSSGKKAPDSAAAAKSQPPQPVVQDNTDNNVAELKSQLAAEQLKEQQAAASNAALPESDTRAAGCRRCLWSDGPVASVCSRLDMPASLQAAEHRPATAHAGAAAGRTARREGPRTCLQLALRIEPGLCSFRRCSRAIASPDAASNLMPTGFAPSNPYLAAAAQPASSLISPRNPGQQRRKRAGSHSRTSRR